MNVETTGYILSVKNCTACGHDHMEMSFYPSNEDENGETHYGTCPLNGDTVYMKFNDDKQN